MSFRKRKPSETWFLSQTYPLKFLWSDIYILHWQFTFYGISCSKGELRIFPSFFLLFNILYIWNIWNQIHNVKSWENISKSSRFALKIVQLKYSSIPNNSKKLQNFSPFTIVTIYTSRIHDTARAVASKNLQSSGLVSPIFGDCSVFMTNPHELHTHIRGCGSRVNISTTKLVVSLSLQRPWRQGKKANNRDLRFDTYSWFLWYT